MTDTPITGSPEWSGPQATPWAGHNESLRRIESGYSRTIIVDRDLTAPPGSCADGARYLVDATATGLWATHDGEIAVAVGANAANGWLFIMAEVEGFRLYVQDEDSELVWDGAVWTSADGAPVGGKQTLPVMAAAMVARTTSGAASGTAETATNKIMLRTLDFDQSTDEFAQFMVPMPKSWDEGTVTARFIWSCGVTGAVVWGIQAVALSDDDVIDAAFGTAVTVTDSVTATTDVMQSAETSALTIAGSPAAEDLVCFQVYRDADNGSDTAAGDAKLIGIRLYVTLDAADDS